MVFVSCEFFLCYVLLFPESVLLLLPFFSKDYLFERVLVKKKKMALSAWGVTGKVSYRRQMFI